MTVPSPAAGERLAGRRILVTGAASGIGLEVSRLFARQGAAVAMTDIQAERLHEAAAELGAHAKAADLRDRPAVAEVVAFAADQLGGLDGVVNCAGVADSAPVDELPPETWDHVLAVNLTAPFLVCRAAVPILRQAADATIVNISSGMGVLPDVPGTTAYAASKGGLIAFSKALAAELAPRIRVNVIAPGVVRTPMTLAQGYLPSNPEEEASAPALQRYALRRASDPGEIAAAVLFLTSAESSYVTGTVLAVDGGRTYH